MNGYECMTEPSNILSWPLLTQSSLIAQSEAYRNQCVLFEQWLHNIVEVS